MTATQELLDAWRLNNQINLRLIDGISAAGMTSTMSTRGGRDVARQFVHLHNVRWAWLSMAGAGPGERHEEAGHQSRAEQGAAQSRAHVVVRGHRPVARFAPQIDDGKDYGRIFAAGPYKALGYFLAHDAHHRGNILLTLKLAGHKVDTKTQYGIWMMWHSKQG